MLLSDMAKQKEPVVPSKGFKYKKNKQGAAKAVIYKFQKEVFVLSESTTSLEFHHMFSMLWE